MFQGKLRMLADKLLGQHSYQYPRLASKIFSACILVLTLGVLFAVGLNGAEATTSYFPVFGLNTFLVCPADNSNAGFVFTSASSEAFLLPA